MSESFLCDLPYLKLIALSGEQTANFLQGQVTCDIREINVTQTRRGAHCNPKGRVLSTFRVLQFEENFYLLTPAVMSNLLIQQLKKYAVFSKVNLTQDDSLKIIGCMGEEIITTLTTLFNRLPEKQDQAETYIRNKEKLICVYIQTNPLRFEIIGSSESITWLKQVVLKKYPTKIQEEWRLLDIQSGIATIYPDTCDLFTPHMLNYPALNAVSFKKGCYTGQEIIARTQYLGKAKRHLYKLSLKSSALPSPGNTLHNTEQEPIGIVVDAIFQTPDESQLLAVLQDTALLREIYWQDSKLLLVASVL